MYQLDPKINIVDARLQRFEVLGYLNQLLGYKVYIAQSILMVSEIYDHIPLD